MRGTNRTSASAQRSRPAAGIDRAPRDGLKAVQLSAGFQVVVHPEDTGTINTVALMFRVCFLIGTARTWELIGGPTTGLGHEVVALLRSTPRPDTTSAAHEEVST